MDCLKDSDFNTSAATDLGVDNAYIFSDSTRLGTNTEEYNNLYPYQCCLFPSYYQAAVRGQERLTLYFNPIFSSQFDYNCHLEDDCLGYGSVNITSDSSNTDLKKATPHSAHWYLMNSIALLETESTQIEFWKNHQVGSTHTLDEVSQRLFGTTFDLLGGTNSEAAQNVVGSHYTAAKVYNSDPLLKMSQYRLYDVSSIFCPTRPKFSHITPSQIDRYHSGLKQPYHNYLTYRISNADLGLQQNNQQIPIEYFNRNFFDVPINNTDTTSNPADDPEFKLQTKLACCVRDDPTSESLYFKTMSRYFTPQVTGGVAGPPYVTQIFSTSRFISVSGACESFLCPNSPICHNLLLNYCSNSLDSHSSQYCRRWHSWASTNYGPKSTNALNNYVSWTALELPWGSHNVGVDMSNRSLLSACSTSQGLGNTTSSLFRDMCQGFSTTFQSNFPRLHTFEWGDAIQYSSEMLFPFRLSHLDSQVNIQVVHAMYQSYTKNEIAPSPPGSKLGWLRRFFRNFNVNYNSLSPSFFNMAMAIMPTKRTDVLSTFFLVEPGSSITSFNFSEFSTTVRDLFNSSLININGHFYFPPPPVTEFKQTLTNKVSFFDTNSGKVDREVTIVPFNANHSPDVVSWVNNTFIVTHSTDGTSFTQRLKATDITRLQDPNFLYSSQSNLQLFGGPSNRALVPGSEAQAVPGNVTYSRVNWTRPNGGGTRSPLTFVPPQALIFATETNLYNSMFDMYSYGNGNFSWTMCGIKPCYENTQESRTVLGPSFGLSFIFPYILPTPGSNYIPLSNEFNLSFMNARVPEGVLGYNAPFNRILTNSNDLSSSLDTDIFYPSIEITFTENAAFMLGLSTSTITIPMPIPTVEPGTTTTQVFQSSIDIPGLPPFNVRNRATFFITNTSNIPLTNISILNSFSSLFDVTLSTYSLLPGERSSVSVHMLDINTITKPPTSLTLYPILFFDSVSWQPSLSSQDFPILGGFYACQTFDDALIKNDFLGNRFSDFVVDPNLANPTDPSYLSNQSIYLRGAVPTEARNLTIVPLV